MGISMRKVERHLDADLFLDEYLRWESGRPHHPYILQQMFAHAETTGQRQHDCSICQGCWQPSPEQDASVEAPAIKLIGYKTTQEEIRVLYPEVYQLKMASRMVLCDLELTGEICQEIFDSLKECLQCRGVHPAKGTRARISQHFQGRPPSPSSSGGCRCRWLLPISRIGSKSHVRRPRWWLGMHTARCWQWLPCWRASSRGWAAPSPMGGLAAVGNWAFASICVVEDARGAVGGACQLATKSRSPQW